MASGLPCVTTDLGTGTSWIVQHGVTGLVVPSNDVAALSAALAQLRDRTLRDAMGRAGRARVEQNFTLTRMIQGVDAVYQDVLREAAPRGR